MKLLFCSPTGALGGAERVLLSILAGVRRLQPDTECHLLALSPGLLIDLARDLGVNTTILPAPPALQSFGDSQFAQGGVARIATSMWRSVRLAWSIGRYIRKLKHVLNEINPDLIYSNGIKTHALLWMASDRKIPVLWHVHDFIGQRPLARRFLGLAVKQPVGVIAVSNAIASDVRRLWPTLPVHVVSNAVDSNAFYPRQSDQSLLDRLAGMSPKACLRVGLVATYARWKGHDIFLAAASRFRQTCPSLSVRFYVIGGPIYQTAGSQINRDELQSMVDHLNIRGDVGFIEHQADVCSIYQCLDVVVHASSKPEPFGLTIIEAMACGKAVIVSMAGGAAEIIRPGFDALGVPPGDAIALADALSLLLHDPGLRHSLGSNARHTIVDRFDERYFHLEILEKIELFAHSEAACV